MKRTTLGLTLIAAALLSGCIIVPHRHGGRGHGHHYSDGGGHYQGSYHQHGGRVYGSPGPRR